MALPCIANCARRAKATGALGPRAPPRTSRGDLARPAGKYVKFYYGYFTDDYELHLEMAEFGPDGFVGYHYGDGTGFNGQVFTPVTDDYDDGRNRVW